MPGLDESSTSKQRKRGGEEEEVAENLKRPRIMVEDNELTTRIKKYLEENRNQKFIDIEKLTLSLHSSYPDYGRRKQAVFKTQVEKAFKELKANLVSKKKNRSQGENQRKAQEVRQEEDTMKGPSMNNRMSNLYGSPKVSRTEDADECEVIEVHEEEEETGASPPTGGKQIGGAGDQNLDTSLTEFEKIKAKAQSVAALMKEGPSPSVQKGKVSPRKKPSKNLSSFMAGVNEAPQVSPPVINGAKDDEEDDDVCEVISDDNDKEDEALVQSNMDVSRITPSTPSDNGSVSQTTKRRLSQAIGNRIEQEENKVRKKKVQETPSATKKRKTAMEVLVETSSVTFADFGGSDEVLSSVCRLLVHLKQPGVYRRLGVSPPQGFLLHGPPGTGKTLLAHAIAGELKLPFIKVAAPELVSGVSGDSEMKIRELFEQATNSSPCMLFIDEIDCITGKRESASKQMEGRMVAQLLACLDTLGSSEAEVVVVGATNRLESLDPALRRAGRFDREIALGIPDRGGRERILEVVCRGLRMSQSTNLSNLAMLTPGYVGADLTSLAREAAMAAVNRVLGGKVMLSRGEQEDELTALLAWLRGDVEGLDKEDLEELAIEKEDWEEALRVVQPSAKREGFATVPGVTWDEVGALSRVREELQLSILAPVTHAKLFEGLGLPSSSGVLLIGPPGCGKTLVAKAIANEAGINFISVKGPELLNMYVGESERAVRGVFQRAKNSSPCVIFFDEVDSLCPKRSSGSSDGSTRVVNQLLTELDGVEGRAGVWVLAATNRPDILDPAVMRPGRLDKTLFVDFPAPLERVEILGAITKGGTRPRLGAGLSLRALGTDSRCDGFSGADMGNLVREASMAALREAIRGGVGCNSGGVVEERHFEKAFASVKPSVGEKERTRYEALKVKYGQTSEDELMKTDKVPTIIGQENVSNCLPSLDTGLSNSLADDAVEEEEGDRHVKSPAGGMDIVDAVKQFPNTETVPGKLTEGIKAIASDGRINGDVEVNVLAGQLCEDILGGASTPRSVQPGGKGEAQCGLRFLPNMVVMVKDCATVDKTSDLPNTLAGRSGRIQSLRPGESVACVVDKNSVESLVQVADLMPELPEEGHIVASLRPDDICQVGKLVSVDDEDQARVSFFAVNADSPDLNSQPESSSPAVLTLPLDRLCKVSMT